MTLTVNKSKRSKDYFEDVLNKCNQERTEEFSLALPTTDLGYKEVRDLNALFLFITSTLNVLKRSSRLG